MEREYERDRDEKNLEEKGMGDTLKGKMKQAQGKMQEKLGEMTGSKEQEIKGKAKETEGKMQSGLGQTERQMHDKGDNRDIGL